MRSIRRSDRDFVYRVFSDPVVTRYLFDEEPLTNPDGADAIISRFLEPEPRGQHRWILVRKEDGAKMGTCGFHLWNRENSRTDIGYDLLEEFWGTGYMREALTAILAFARREMEVDTVKAHISVDNAASIALARRLGFRFEGEAYDEAIRGQTYPHRVYVLHLGE